MPLLLYDPRARRQLAPVPCRVLVVDDNALVTDALSILLESAGHVVRSAATVAGTIARCLEERPDVMLLDLTLPDGDGLNALATVRTRDAAPTLTVALTGHDDPRTIARCRAAGCRDVLVKPVPARELLALVAQWEEEIRDRRVY